MGMSIRNLSMALAPLLLCACATLTQAPTAAAARDADAAFTSIHEKEWAWRRNQTAEDEDSGAAPARNRLPDVDEAHQQAKLKVWDDVLRQLAELDEPRLSPDNRINLAIYREQLENLAAQVRFRNYQMPFNSDSSFWSNLGFMAQGRFDSAEDYRAYIAKLNDVPRYFRQHMQNMRDGIARGFTVPQAVLDGRDVSIANIAQAGDVESLALYAPFTRMPGAMPVALQQELRDAARHALSEKVIPAFAELLAFFREEYVPNARTTLAAEALPDGEAFYRQQIREYTTLDLSPEEIHNIGLAEVARIRSEMDAIIRELEFKGDFAAFLHFLRTDPQFYPKTPKELLMRAAWIAKRVDAVLPRFIGHLPRGSFGIVEVPPDIAPFWTAGRGGAKTYWLNTYNLPSRPLYNLPALTLHESSPGHSLQQSLAGEQESLPTFRRETYISAYGEGWALYCEKLGKEMGIYETPYEDFGRLTYEMWRAARLVIDTGLHHYGWSREAALAYLRDNTALSEHEITTEVDRYISWPGQALSYKLGEIRIVELRAEAEKALGETFDIRAFHDALLKEGSVPLSVLEMQVGKFIQEQKGK
ncbi:MAG: DUF885 family protein [Lysobacteraceae bacterium]